MSAAAEIHGTCDPRFAAVRDAFAANFTDQDEIGAAVAVVADGRLVVDLWAGWADPGRTRPWQRDTIANVYSCTKGMTALCLHRLVETGRVDLDAPVARYWPEFAQGDKGRIPVRWLLSHRAGLAAVKPMLPESALYDWNAMTTALAAETPWWEPGSTHGYHAVTFGWLVGEVVKRVSGRSLGTFFRDEVAGPLGLDFHIGLDESHHGRAADLTMIPMPPPEFEGPRLAAVIMSDPEGVAARAFMNPISLAHGPNLPAWRSAEIPGANGHAGARDLARAYGVLARGGEQDGVRLAGRETIDAMRTEQSVGPDLVLGVSTRFGLGFMLPQDAPDTRFGPGTGSFGHPGAGGHLGFADPEAGVGFGYVMNRLGPHILVDPRATRLANAAYETLGA
ncbi:MAG: beta-lactamase family protein [bacterium]|nr:beta-lactamase family protein [bacterium]